MHLKRYDIVVVTVLVLALGACAKRAPVVHTPTATPPPMEASPPTPTPPVKKPPPKKPAAPPVAEGPGVVLTGLSQPEVVSAFGQPQEQRDSNPGRIWIYRAGACEVEILFLLDVMRNDDFVVDHRVSGTDGTPKSEQACFRRIASRNGK